MPSLPSNRAIIPGRSQRIWVAETLVVLGIVAFGLFVLTLEGNIQLNAQTPAAVDLPYELTR